jgi:hypothetical protein
MQKNAHIARIALSFIFKNVSYFEKKRKKRRSLACLLISLVWDDRRQAEYLPYIGFLTEFAV